MTLNKKQSQLAEDLQALYIAQREETYSKYKRINPFFEDLCDWKERGLFWSKNKNVTIYNSTTIVGEVKIGEDTWVGPFVLLDGTGGLDIGSNCSISTGCQILTHDTVAWALSGGKQGYSYESTKIGDRCFIGTHAIITKGITIGNECVVGAGAVVTKSFPDNSIILGNPGKLSGKTIVNDMDGSVSFEYF